MSFGNLVFDARQDFDASLASEVLEKAGCIQILGAIESSRLEEVRQPAVEYFESNDTTGAYMWMAEQNPVRPSNAILKALWNSPAREVVLSQFNQREAIVLLRNSIFRWMSPVASEGHLRLHQDARVVAEGDRLITVWMPLWPDEISRDSNGLELVPYETGYVPLAPNARFGLEIDESEIAKFREVGRVWQPNLHAGDLLVFCGMCPHGSQIAPTAKLNRLSLEIRFVPRTPHVTEIINGADYPGHFVFRDDQLIGPTEAQNKHIPVEEFVFSVGEIRK